MLWVEYEVSKPVELSFVAQVVENLFAITAPYPVVAFDSGEFGLGLIVREQREDFESPITIDSAITAGPYGVLITDFTSPKVSSDKTYRPESKTQAASISYTDFDTTARKSAAGSTSPSYTSNNGDHNLERFQGNQKGDKKKTADQFRENGEAGDNQSEDGRGAGNGDNSSITTRPKSSTTRKSGTFIGRPQLTTPDSMKQDLGIRFDLQILPKSSDSQCLPCTISIDKLSVDASRTSEGSNCTDFGDDSSEPWFVVHEVLVTVGPSDGAGCDGPSLYRPQTTDFLIGRTISTSSQAEINVELSAPPKFTISGTCGKSTSTNLTPTAIELNPASIGPGRNLKEWRWKYKVGKESETHAGLPTHEATYDVDLDSEPDRYPDHFKVMIQVKYRRQGRIRCPKSLLFFERQHILMVLETHIKRDGLDFYEFPGATKRGSTLSMEIQVNGSMFADDKPRLSSTGLVQSTLGGVPLRYLS